MLSEERHNHILQELALHQRVLVADLCKSLDVSIDTIRRDLKELEKKGKVVKVHGGAVAPDFHYPFQQHDVYAKQEKQQVATKALQLIKDGMTILAGGGTVMLELARLLPENLKGVFFTVSPLVALEVTQRSDVEVILLAGRLSRNSYICTGSSVISQLSEIKADLCFLGTNGLSVKEGVTESDWEVAQIKKAMIKSSEKTAVLCISEKLETTQKMLVCKLSQLDYLCTELKPKDAELKKYGEKIKLLL
jgi:DeoR/GlpR family transcriptional regulator of sugar metabolism